MFSRKKKFKFIIQIRPEHCLFPRILSSVRVVERPATSVPNRVRVAEHPATNVPNRIRVAERPATSVPNPLDYKHKSII